MLHLLEVNVEDFDAVAIPGGFEKAGFYKDAYSREFLDIIRKFSEQGKPIASICVGALPVGRSGILTGRRATTYHLLEGKRRRELAAMGAVVVDTPLVQDGNIITSTSPATAIDVAFTLLEALTSPENANRIKKLMGFDSYNAKFVHINIISENWGKLAQFYERVFGCKCVLPERDMSGKWIEDGTGVFNAHIKGIHLRLPGYDENGPTLEIFQYNRNILGEKPKINQTGLVHIAFLVDDVESALSKVLSEGGSQLGKIVMKDIPEVGKLIFVYAKDPEGNIIELQNWEK